MLSAASCRSEHYRLTVDDPYTLLHEQPEKEYRAGEHVTIKTGIVIDADVECFVNGESIGKQTVAMTGDKYTHWEFYFEMPAEDVTLTILIVGSKPCISA